MSSQSVKVRSRCAYKGDSGRCRRMTTTTHPYCGEHTRRVLGVSVKKSLIPKAGLGLFAERTFKKGQNIVQYTGELISVDTYDARYKNEICGAYGIAVNDHQVIDAVKTSSSVARYACDYHGSGQRANAQYVSDDKEVWIVARRTIQPGEEIYTDYGSDMHRALGLK